MDETKDFVNAHLGKNYGWIFTRLNSDQDGYIKAR